MKDKIIKKLKEISDKKTAIQTQKFFKTGKGEYGEGDKFLGIRVPMIRKMVDQYQDITIKETVDLLYSEFHEVRMFAVLALVQKYERGKSVSDKEAIYKIYIKHAKAVNNWDLVDSSAHKIVGDYILITGGSKILDQLVQSKNLWERRIAIVATFQLIKNNKFDKTLYISKLLLNDKEDLIHKAVGWMLREVGKKDFKVEDHFLQEHYKIIPRTMLRYAIERFPEERRLAYLKGDNIAGVPIIK